MAVKEVLLIGNEKLREKSLDCRPPFEEVPGIINNLKDTLHFLQEKYKIGRALAAPQIGYLKRIIYYNHSGSRIIMINPRITYKSDRMFPVWDSCYSFKTSFFVKIKRHQSITVRFLNDRLESEEREFSGSLSELFQHEIDHLEGVLATDYLEKGDSIIMREEWEKIK